MDNYTLQKYKYNGARALVILHEKHLKILLQTWREAKRANIKLPGTEDQDYQSLETLLFHIFRAARGYMTWMCEKLDLPEPGINHPPDMQVIEQEADTYLDHLLEKWRTPLVDVEPEKFETKTFPSRWGTEYCIDAMLEHAVMHPIRHEFQLRNLINEQK